MLRLLRDETAGSTKIIEDLHTKFPEIDFRLYRSNDVNQFITCFVAIFPSACSCADTWNDVNSAVALSSQAVMHSDTAPWNLYLLISVPESLPREIKYRIENDRFASRKITMAQYGTTTDADPYQSTLENIILGRDLELTKFASPDQSVDSTKDANETTQAELNKYSFVRDFLAQKPGLIPQDRKPVSSLLRQQYLTEMISLNLKS